MEPKDQIEGHPVQMSMKEFIDSQNQLDYMNPTHDPGYLFKNKILADNFKLIDVGAINYDKKVVFIYNPSSGKKRDRRHQIAETMEKYGIQFEILTTTRANDALEMVRDMNIDNYSAIVAVGGDGTIHEVINGLMYREDQKKVPIGFIPNGTGNDLCAAIELSTFEEGLDYLLKGNTIKMDVMEAVLDHESREEVMQKAKDTPSFNPFKHLRYSCINTQLLLVGLTAKNAVPMKPYIGSTAYTISCIIELIRRQIGIFDIEFENGKYKVENLVS